MRRYGLKVRDVAWGVARQDKRCSLKEGSSTQPEPRQYGVVDFAVDGDLRFLSHQEMLRLFGRACVRAGIPVRQSQGFNPRPRISLPLPRPVGIASDVERAILELTERLSPARLRDHLATHMPDGITIHQALVVGSQVACVPRRVHYSVSINGCDQADAASIASGMMRFKPIVYRRFVHKKSRHTLVDLRPYLSSIEVTDGDVLFALHITGGGTAKPAEICDLLGIGGENVNHLIRRRKIIWQ